jgi:glucokinase
MMSNCLLADIGGTNSRLAMLAEDGAVAGPARYCNGDFDSLDAVLAEFIATQGSRPDAAAIAIAGPVVEQAVTMTNLGWQISAASLQRQHGIPRVTIMNDFAALAWATLALDQSEGQADIKQADNESELHQLGGGSPLVDASRGILGPGTGLGVSGLIRGDGGWAVLAGEGGHVTLAATTAAEYELVQSLTTEFGHCSAERVLSGPGLANIYRHFNGPQLSPEEIIRAANSGDASAVQAVGIFCALLGSVAGDLALTLGARGGIYLAGGILPGILPLLERSEFRARFEAKGRFHEYLAAIPTFVITAPEPSLRGLARYMGEVGLAGVRHQVLS